MDVALQTRAAFCKAPSKPGGRRCFNTNRPTAERPCRCMSTSLISAVFRVILPSSSPWQLLSSPAGFFVDARPCFKHCCFQSGDGREGFLRFKLEHK